MTPDVATPVAPDHVLAHLPSRPTSPQTRTASVLVVDDDDDTRAALAYMLTSAGLPVLEACDAKTALRLARTAPISAVVLDIILPDRSGYDVCRELRQTVGGVIPIILVTGLSSIMDDGAWVLAGGDAYLVKPVRRAVLIAHVVP